MVGLTNSREAAERILKEKSDLIALDVFMPGLDGFQLTERIRSSSSEFSLISPGTKNARHVNPSASQSRVREAAASSNGGTDALGLARSQDPLRRLNLPG